MLPFTVALFEDNVMKTLKIEHAVVSPLEYVNVEETDGTLVRHLAPIPFTVHDMSITFSGPSSTATANP